MKDELINFETAKLAQIKGFRIPTDTLYNPRDPNSVLEGNIVLHLLKVDPDLSKHLFRPTQSLLQKWLREVNNLDVLIYKEDIDNYTYHVWGETGRTVYTWDTYEEALEEGLLQALKLIK